MEHRTTPLRRTGTGRSARTAALEVTVSPRYLAGAGDSTRALTSALTAAGWHTWHRTPADFHLASPCGRGYLRHQAPGARQDGGAWMAWGRPGPHAARSWLLTASPHTPAEPLAALATAWATDPGPRPQAHTREGAQQLLTPLIAARWIPETRPTPHRHRLFSPDQYCALELDQHADPDPDPFWGPAYAMITAAPDRDQPPLWTVRASRRTPARLLAAFATTLTDPAPVRRHRNAIPQALAPYLAIT